MRKRTYRRVPSEDSDQPAQDFFMQTTKIARITHANFCLGWAHMSVATFF